MQYVDIEGEAELRKALEQTVRERDERLELTCGPTENPNMKAAEWIALHLADLTAALQRLTAVLEKQEKP